VADHGEADTAPTEDTYLGVIERILVSPCIGIFEPLDLKRGDIVTVGTPVGRVNETPVISSFTGEFIGMLAAIGERVRRHQPVAWLRMS
jgi:hypothetical protein